MKLLPTRRTDYGIRALIFLANTESASAKASQIGAAMDIPTGFLHQVLQVLQRAGLVTSRPGPSGGYALARAPDEVTILEIVEGLEGPIRAKQCALRGGPCHWNDVCALHSVWSSATAALAEQLAASTLSEVARQDRDLAVGTAVVPVDSHRRGNSSPVLDVRNYRK